VTKPIRSYPEEQRAKVVERRLRGKTGGLGYLSAVEAKKHMEKAVAKEKAKVEET